MSLSRAALSYPRRSFGRAPLRLIPDTSQARRGVADDVKLFAATFAAGFVFVSILIG